MLANSALLEGELEEGSRDLGIQFPGQGSNSHAGWEGCSKSGLDSRVRQKLTPTKHGSVLRRRSRRARH